MTRKGCNDKIIFTTEDWGEIFVYLMIIAVNVFGDYIEDNPNNYSCPNYCEIAHEHINIKEIENEFTRIDSGLFIQPREQGEIAEGIE
tara:strand:+ start:526 stop:789 length:264 start_codon:yes stop_codon:yes gene_type:complete